MIDPLQQPCPPLRFGDAIFTHDPGFISWRIRSATNGWSNHMAVVMDDERAVQATLGHGVHYAPTTSLTRRPCLVCRPQSASGGAYIFTDEQEAACWRFLLPELGSLYDTKAIAGFLLFSYRNLWNNPQGWFCSELGAECYRQAGFPLFNGTVDGASVSPTACAVSGRLQPLWHSLPPAVTRHMRLEGVHHR